MGAVSTLAFRDVGLPLMKFTVDPPKGTIGLTRSLLDLLQEVLSLLDLSTSVTQSLLSGSTSSLGLLGGSLEGSTSGFSTLSGSLQGNLGLAKGKRILSLQLRELGLGLVAADNTALLTSLTAISNLAVVCILLGLDVGKSGLELLLGSLKRGFSLASFLLTGSSLLMTGLSNLEELSDFVKHLLGGFHLLTVVTLRSVHKLMPVRLEQANENVGDRNQLDTGGINGTGGAESLSHLTNSHGFVVDLEETMGV